MRSAVAPVSRSAVRSSAATGSGREQLTTLPELRAFGPADLDGAIALFADEGWLTYAQDPERTCRALVAPGSTTLVALDSARVVGLVQLQSDGEIQAHLSALLVPESWRGRGRGRTLLREAFERAGASASIYSLGPGATTWRSARRRFPAFA